jgi:hypothetical protein
MARAFAYALALVASLAVTSLLPARGRAQAPGEAITVIDPIDIPPENDPLAHAWDLPGQRGGFYLRGTIGLGVINTRLGAAPWESELDYSATVNGFGTGYGIDIGGLVRPWLALHLDTTLGVLWSGDLERSFGTLGDNDGTARILAYGFAPAVTFFTRNDFYLKPAFGVGFATVKRSGKDFTSDPGFYMHLVAGKELVVDDHFSFGLQFEIAYMLLGAERAEEKARIRQFLFGVSFGFDSL